ncbi:MAG: hypothetical protein BJ554DRAFT_7158 [Olpidium bornovanus]|uniref:RRM domain-containing protein n=1 Tax=Olpidium bornovanus TaxID=278681 RepID=A0A8H7ZWW3_9FUNG|nr:MAG: hypothetical protein BJ554DRAFT_7158 [Olpidium bornovanus]
MPSSRPVPGGKVRDRMAANQSECRSTRPCSSLPAAMSSAASGSTGCWASPRPSCAAHDPGALDECCCGNYWRESIETQPVNPGKEIHKRKERPREARPALRSMLRPAPPGRIPRKKIALRRLYIGGERTSGAGAAHTLPAPASLPRTPPPSTAPWRAAPPVSAGFPALPASVTEQDLRSAFAETGQVQKTSVVRDLLHNKSRGFGFVLFADEEDAKVAFEKGRAGDILIGDGRARVKVEFAHWTRSKRRTGNGRIVRENSTFIVENNLAAREEAPRIDAAPEYQHPVQAYTAADEEADTCVPTPIENISFVHGNSTDSGVPSETAARAPTSVVAAVAAACRSHNSISGSKPRSASADPIPPKEECNTSTPHSPGRRASDFGLRDHAAYAQPRPAGGQFYHPVRKTWPRGPRNRGGWFNHPAKEGSPLGSLRGGQRWSDFYLDYVYSHAYYDGYYACMMEVYGGVPGYLDYSSRNHES